MVFSSDNSYNVEAVYAESTELDNPNLKTYRWVVEVCHSWNNRFRKL